MGKRLMVIGLSAVFVLSGVAVSAGAPATGPLAQVIEGAKKEGTVSVVLRTGFTPSSMERLRKEIKEKFGADLDIKFSPSEYMPKELAQAIMEQKVGAPPSRDLITFMDTQVAQGMKAGVFERVDWKSLITPDMNPEVVCEEPLVRGAIVYFSAYIGTIYNPNKVSADKAPKTLRELADPKWRGNVGVFNYTATWARWALVLGKEKVLNELRAILKNGAIQGRFADLSNRYLLGEISVCFINSGYFKEVKDKGMPTAWQHLDLAEIQNFTAVVRQGAKHPNAAKLLALYLASPAGAKFTLDEAGSGTVYYPGNYEHDIRVQAKRQGIREISIDRNLLEFSISKEGAQLEKELKLVFDTGGER